MRNRVDQPDGRLGAGGDVLRRSTGKGPREHFFPSRCVMALAALEVPLPGLHKRPLLALVDAHKVTTVDRKVDVMADQAFEVAVWIAVMRRGRGDQFLQRLVEKRGEDLILALEVAVERRSADADAFSDLVDPDAMKAPLVHERRRLVACMLFAM